MQTNMSILYTPTTSFTELSQDSQLNSGTQFICSNNTKARFKATKDSFYSPESAEIVFISPSSCLPCLDCSFPQKPQWRPLPIFPPCSFCLLTNPGASPCGSWWQSCSLLLGTVSNKLSFQWRSSPDLLASPYLGDNKAYILQVIVLSREDRVEISGRAPA